jgi:hypothetical protein
MKADMSRKVMKFFAVAALVGATAGIGAPAWAGCANEIPTIEARAVKASDATKRQAALQALSEAKRLVSERREAACMTAVDKARHRLR